MLLSHALYLTLALQSLCTATTQVLNVSEPKPATRIEAMRKSALPRASRLASRVRASVVDELPAGWRLRALQLATGGNQAAENAVAGGGDVQVNTRLPDNLLPGYNLVDVDVQVAGIRKARLEAHVELVPTVVAKQVPVIARGQEVMVVVRHGNVTVQAKGTAQQAAGVGERIFVLPNSGSHTLQAVVRDASTVEVPL